jgi:hypothetical protein
MNLTSFLEIPERSFQPIEEFCSSLDETERADVPGSKIIVFQKQRLAVFFHDLFLNSYGLGEGTEIKHLTEKSVPWEQKGFQVLHVYETEWNHEIKHEIWKSMILNKLQMTRRKIFARKCSLVPVDAKTARSFVELNHLQGAGLATLKFGLVHDGDLVSVMTFGTPRFSKNYQWELIRFCSLRGCNVVGGASKLFSHFRKNHKEPITTYANMRWSDGNLYKKLGFTFLRCAGENYSYFKMSDRILYPRIKFQHHKLEKALEIYDPNLGELENVLNNGYRRIFDRGNMVLEMI